MLVGTTIVETRAGVKAKETVDVFAGERTLHVIAQGGLNGRHSGSQVIGGITPSTVGEASVFDKDEEATMPRKVMLDIILG